MGLDSQRLLDEINRKLRGATVALLKAEINLQTLINRTPVDPPESDGKLRGMAAQLGEEDVG